MIYNLDHYKLMTLDQLIVLNTIIRTGSFRQASQELHRAQSAISYAIKQLEDQVGFAIFDRSEYRPQLTPQGQTFLRQVKEVLHQHDRLNELAEFLKRGYEPKIRILISALWPIPLLAQALNELNRQYPHTEIKLIHDVLSADEQLKTDQADIGFGHFHRDDETLHYQKILSIDMIPVCSPLNRLAQNKGNNNPEQLKSEHQIVLRSTLQTTNRSSGILNPARIISVNDYLAKKELLLSGVGWGFMPEHLVKIELQQKQLLRTHDEQIKINLGMAYARKKSLGPCGKLLWDYFQPEHVLRRNTHETISPTHGRHSRKRHKKK